MAHANNTHTIFRPDKDAWMKYFLDSAEGKSSTTGNKRFTVLKSSRAQGSDKETPHHTVNLVTEAAQGAQIAKSELKQEERELKSKATAPARTYRRAPPSKRKKPKVIKSQHSDIFQ